jgi:hypothetical protein
MSWKWVTDHDDTKVMINLDHVRRMVRIDDSTVIYFDKDDNIDVKETPDEISLAPPLRVS